MAHSPLGRELQRKYRIICPEKNISFSVWYEREEFAKALYTELTTVTALGHNWPATDVAIEGNIVRMNVTGWKEADEMELAGMGAKHRIIEAGTAFESLDVKTQFGLLMPKIRITISVTYDNPEMAEIIYGKCEEAAHRWWLPKGSYTNAFKDGNTAGVTVDKWVALDSVEKMTESAKNKVFGIKDIFEYEPEEN